MGVGALFCVFSFLCGLVLIWMDKESDKREGIKQIRQSSLEDRVYLSQLKKF